MGHHRRTEQAKLRRAARRYIINHAYHDRLWAETVSVTSRAELIEFLVTFKLADGVDYRLVPDVEKGLVLVDSRGRGEFQK